MATMQQKLRMTPEMGEKLKDFRNLYKVKAKDVATFLDKSGAYISKLEKGEIQNIEKQEFVRIVNYITKTEEGYATFFEYVSSLMDSKELENSLMFLNYDWCDRILPIPEKLLKYMKDKIANNNIIISELVDYVNLNEELDDAFFEERNLDKDTTPVNTWIPYFEVDSITVDRHFILVSLEDEEVRKILNGEIRKSAYLKIFALLYHINKIERKKEKIKLEDSDFTNMKKKTEKKLMDFKFYTLSGKKMLLTQVTEEGIEVKNVLSSYEYKNNDLISDILQKLMILSDYDIDYMNKKLEVINDNLDKVGASFAIAYMALSLEGLADKTVAIKKEFLSDVSELINRYASSINEEFEKY